MWKRIAAVLGASAMVAVVTVSAAGARGSVARTPGDAAPYEPVLDPANFVSVIDNPYYPLPVGRVLVYKGVRDGSKQIDTVTVTDQTKVLEGITGTAVSDVAKTPGGKLLEKTTDWYAQDTQGNVWYLGEDTKAYLPNGQVDPSGSWQSEVNDGEPGIIMEGDPQIPDAYRQEFLLGQAEDTAWITGLGGSLKVPYGTVHNVLTSLEHTTLEPDVVDQKVYAPGLGIVMELALAGGQEVAKLVSVTG
jgi:hypothetical protein